MPVNLIPPSRAVNRTAFNFPQSPQRPRSTGSRWRDALLGIYHDAAPLDSSPPPQLRFNNAQGLRIALEGDRTLCRRIAEGAVFKVRGQEFKLAWTHNYDRVMPMHLGPDVQSTSWLRRLVKDVSAQLDANTLRDAMTCFIDGSRLERGEIPADIRADASEHRLIGIREAPKWLRFSVRNSLFGQPEWSAVDTRKQGCLYRFRMVLQRLFRPRALRQAQAKRDTWLRLLNANLVPGGAHRGEQRTGMSAWGAGHPGRWPGNRDRVSVHSVEVEAVLAQILTGWSSWADLIGISTRLPPVGERDRRAFLSQQQAREAIQRRWPSLPVRSPLTVQVLLWHPELTFAQASELAASWDRLLLPEEVAPAQENRAANLFTDLMARLGEAVEFSGAAKRLAEGGTLTTGEREIIRRVQRVLCAVHDDSEIRQQCFAIADEGLHRCGDRVALCFSTIEAECMVHTIDGNDGVLDGSARLRNRIDLARRMFRSAKLEELSASYLLNLPPSVDAVEHRLHLQRACQQRGVVFPVAIGNVHYGADVPTSVVDSVVAGIMAAERDVGALVNYVAQLGFWKRFLEQQRPDVFDAACADLDADLKALGVHEMRLTGMETYIDSEDAKATTRRNVDYFYKKYPDIRNLAQPPQLNSEQFILIRSQIAAGKVVAMARACRELTARLLAYDAAGSKA
ncbi:E3 ligase-like protein (putative virulence factor) [Cupriavidus gilardii J11]|uniref:E3 ligase-like protein (Putative virulence factor) n=1 Tax=Cupriavidus gilardii J11 TaxID=936133 RepID=A0A562BNC2_9BURK|nr:E3 ligase-like protein (putative virulence factor) [Cupriavidus gilardii J11]